MASPTRLQGVIGTGLFLGTASVLQTAGPVGMLLAYLIIGSICYTVMVSWRIYLSFECLTVARYPLEK